MRVLILSATTGGGHMSAANALRACIIKNNPENQVFLEDTLQWISPTLNKAVTEGYVYLATKTPKMYGNMYKTTDKDDTALTKVVNVATNQISRRLLPLIEKTNPDIIITTHSFSTEMVSMLKEDNVIDIPLVSIITDFAPHKTYLQYGVDAYIVSSNEMVSDMVERGIDRVKIYPYGIPIGEQFFEEYDKEKLLEEEGFDPSLKTVLIMAGSFGVTDILKIYHNIVAVNKDFQIIVITGKNEKLYETFDRYLSKIILKNALIEDGNSSASRLKTVKHPRKPKPSKPTKLLYFTDQVAKYMHISDIIVTKPGGLTVSESIASHLPMAIYKPIPGQEEQNADFLVSKNMAVRLIKGKECTQTVENLLDDNGVLEQMKQDTLKFYKGNSAENIYLLLKEICDRKKN